jgi:acetolactate synthase-1/3 small subunit
MQQKDGTHTISLLVANKPGVLVRCAQVFARRGYNIDGLVVSPGVNPKFSRMTITASGDPATLDQIIKQCAKLVDVVHAAEHTQIDAISREFTLIKIKSTANVRPSILQIIENFAHVVDEDESTVIIGQYGTTQELDLLEGKLRTFGIIEMVRSGKLVMAKGQEET